MLTPAEATDWDRRAESAGISVQTLMDAAGRACAEVIARRYAHALRSGVLVAAGTGNNGGDGWVLARTLHRHDVAVWVAALPGTRSPLNEQVRDMALREGVREVSPDGPWPSVGIAVDAVLGTGARGAPREPASRLLDRLRELRLPLVALDGPSGVELLSGAVWGSAAADLSITFGGLRRGHLLARDQVGEVVVVDIGLPPPDATDPLLMTDGTAASWLAPFSARAHKGERGRVVVVGGDTGMGGALRLAARAAFASGAGLVHAVAPAATIAALIEAEPDLQTRAAPLEGDPGAPLHQLVDGADALVIGPGLGRAPSRRPFVAALIRLASRVVLDADGLVAFHGALPELVDAAQGRDVVLTPHPGEFRGLFPHLAGSLDVDPWAAAAAAAAETGTTVLLKGVPSVVAERDQPLRTIATGTPGLATGGSGDVLAGICGAMLGAGLPPMQAAALAAQALGRAGELAARRHTARAMRPMDVVAALPDLWRAWSLLRDTPPRPDPPILLELGRPAG